MPVVDRACPAASRWPAIAAIVGMLQEGSGHSRRRRRAGYITSAAVISLVSLMIPRRRWPAKPAQTLRERVWDELASVEVEQRRPRAAEWREKGRRRGEEEEEEDGRGRFTEKTRKEGAAGGLDVEDEGRPRRQRELQPPDAAAGGGGGGLLGRRRHRRQRGGLEELDSEGGAGEADRREGYAFTGASLDRVSRSDHENLSK